MTRLISEATLAALMALSFSAARAGTLTRDMAGQLAYEVSWAHQVRGLSLPAMFRQVDQNQDPTDDKISEKMLAYDVFAHHLAPDQARAYVRDRCIARTEGIRVDPN